MTFTVSAGYPADTVKTKGFEMVTVKEVYDKFIHTMQKYQVDYNLAQYILLQQLSADKYVLQFNIPKLVPCLHNEIPVKILFCIEFLQLKNKVSIFTYTQYEYENTQLNHIQRSTDLKAIDVQYVQFDTLFQHLIKLFPKKLIYKNMEVQSPPIQYIKRADHHWVEVYKKYTNEIPTLMVLQWGPNSKNWSISGQIAASPDCYSEARNLSIRWIAHCPQPA